MNSCAAMEYDRFAVVERAHDLFQDFPEMLSPFGKETELPNDTVPVLACSLSTFKGFVNVDVVLDPTRNNNSGLRSAVGTNIRLFK